MYITIISSAIKGILIRHVLVAIRIYLNLLAVATIATTKLIAPTSPRKQKRKMKTNITYNFDAFEEASKIMRQCVANLSEKNARQQIAAMAMQAILSNPNLVVEPLTIQEQKDLATESVRIADTLIAELDKKK